MHLLIFELFKDLHGLVGKKRLYTFESDKLFEVEPSAAACFHGSCAAACVCNLWR